MNDGGDLRKRACCAELVDGLGAHKVVCRHPEPGSECCETVDVGLTALGQTGERRRAHIRFRRYILPGEAPRPAFGVQRGV